MQWSVNARSVAARRRALRAEVGLVERWANAQERSRRRRKLAKARRRKRRLCAAALGGVGMPALSVMALLAFSTLPDGRPVPEQGAAILADRAHAAGKTDDVPASPARVQAARRYADRRSGIISFAVLDEDGLRGVGLDRRYVSASVVKAMLLVAEIRRLRDERVALHSADRAILEAMITVSDNSAADSIYHRVGDQGLREVAAAARMKNFSVSGYWANAQITAADQARLFFDLNRNLKGPYRSFAGRLLAGISNDQRWGIFAGVGRGWRVQLKGGWRATELGNLVHQAARLERRGERYGLAVLTDGQPSHEYGVETIEGVTRRLIG